MILTWLNLPKTRSIQALYNNDNDTGAKMNKTTHSRSFLSATRQLRFEALQHALVPRSKRFSASEKQASLNLVNTLLAQQSDASRKKLALFLLLIDLVSCLRFARVFRQLPANKQKCVLTSFFQSPLGLFRKGFWGLNTLARLGVYGQTSLHSEIGYSLRKNPRDTDKESPS